MAEDNSSSRWRTGLEAKTRRRMKSIKSKPQCDGVSNRSRTVDSAAGGNKNRQQSDLEAVIDHW